MNLYMIANIILLSALVVLLIEVVAIFALHLYVRQFLVRLRPRHLLACCRNAAARTRVDFPVDQGYNPATTVESGLEARVLRSLPVFTYSVKTHPDSVMECAVCLSEFEESESGRILPKCNHSFHIECIDMWFHSHSTCPLCRTLVEAYNPVPANPADVAFTIQETIGVESGPASCQHENEQIGTSSVGRRMNLSVEVPSRNGEGFEGESSACDSATSQSSYRSPMSRMLSFKGILSKERRQSPCASPRTVTVIESDTGRGENQV
ncbi:hypothetical protein SLE2022_290790 [Rubroshorea leprosula]